KHYDHSENKTQKPKFLNVGKSAFYLPKNVLAWVLCHLVGGTPLSKKSVYLTNLLLKIEIVL
ncbi:hypothetical protein OCF60_29195, partial [Bacillus paranthracis]|uniref:hypothetical protein n=1 Tax=Bacillus paranthracis TaxID=2026186 RepID=UPI0021D21C46